MLAKHPPVQIQIVDDFQVRVSVMLAPLNSPPSERITTDWELPRVVSARSAEKVPARTTT